MNKLTIVQLLPELNTGGVERGATDLSNELSKRGYRSYVISNGGKFEEEIVSNGGHHFKLPIHKKSLSTLFLAKKLYNLYKEIKPDIVHVRSRVPALVNLIAYNYFKEKKPILISTFHGLYSKPFYSQVMSKVDHTIAISNTVKEYIKDNYKLSDDHISFIPRGCDLNKFNKESLDKDWIDNFFLNFSNVRNKKILTLPGRITRWKGAESFIDLIENLDNSYHGLIVGPVAKNKKKYLSMLKKLIHEKNLDNKITFTGGVSDIENIYKISDIVFNLSFKPEPFGRTTIEAISCGTKVVGWDHGGTKEILENLFPSGLVELSNINILKEVTIKVANNEIFPKGNIYTSDLMIDKTISLYESLSSDS